MIRVAFLGSGVVVGGGRTAETLEAASQAAIVGQDIIAQITAERPVKEVTSGAFQDQAARRDIPQTYPRLDIGVHAAARDIDEVQSRGPHDAHLASTGDKVLKAREHMPKIGVILGEADGDDSLGEAAAGADVNDSIV